MGVLHIYVYSLIANLIFVASGSKLKAMENLFRGEIYLLREEVTSVVANQESIMKVLNETTDKISDLTGTSVSNINDQAKITYTKTNQNTDNQMEALSNLSEELIRTRRGFHEEKVARKHDKESLLDLIENKIAVAMATKMDEVIENVETSNKMLQALDEKVATTHETLAALNAKVSGIEKKLDNLEMLQINEKLGSINTVIEKKCLSGVSSIKTDVQLFKTFGVSVLGRLFSRNHYPASAIQECLDAKNIDDTYENAETCLIQNSQSLNNLLLPEVHLVGGSVFSQGRVEVLYNGTYGTICDDNWTPVNSQVVCKMLGFTSGASVLSGDMVKRFGKGTGNIILDDVRRTGEEKSLFDCEHPGFGIHNCGHGEDVAVVCS